MSKARCFGKITAVFAASALLIGVASSFGAGAGAAPSPVSAGGQWQLLSAAPLPFYPQAAMLLTDGSVMLQEVTSDQWWRLRPDASGNYNY